MRYRFERYLALNLKTDLLLYCAAFSHAWMIYLIQVGTNSDLRIDTGNPPPSSFRVQMTRRVQAVVGVNPQIKCAARIFENWIFVSVRSITADSK